MTRWIMIALTVAGLILAILTRSAGLLGLGLLMVLVGLFGMVFSIAADRISSNARPETTMLSAEALMAIREKAKADALARASQPDQESRRGAAIGSRQS